MKKILLPVFLVTAIVVLLITNLYFMKPQNKKNDSPQGNGFAVVELFTSEGCSSCPPADELAAKLSEEYNGKLFVLGFHVDYWNNLGWTDIYSNADYSKRQEKYAQLFHLNSVYTPQVIVNGKTEMVGSDENKLRNAILTELKNTPAFSISMNAKSDNNKYVNVSYKINSSSNEILNIALVQLHAETAVKRGENSGHVLKHINVVRDFKTINVAENDDGTINLTLPEGFSAKDCKVIAWLQDAGNFTIKAASESFIQ